MMMIGLTLVLLTSLVLFLGALFSSVLQDLDQGHKIDNRMIAENLDTAGRPPVNNSFVRASRRPARVLGTFIL